MARNHVSTTTVVVREYGNRGDQGQEKRNKQRAHPSSPLAGASNFCQVPTNAGPWAELLYRGSEYDGALNWH
jgi:hypothetical protein